jgi:hypothetical protein
MSERKCPLLRGIFRTCGGDGLGSVAFRPDHAGIVNALTYDMAVATCFATRVEKRRPLSGDRIVPEPMFAVDLNAVQGWTH